MSLLYTRTSTKTLNLITVIHYPDLAELSLCEQLIPSPSRSHCLKPKNTGPGVTAVKYRDQVLVREVCQWGSRAHGPGIRHSPVFVLLVLITLKCSVLSALQTVRSALVMSAALHYV